jgi:predicted DNA-binding protein with PD1-like motif
MRSKLLDQRDGQRTYALVFDSGEDAEEGLLSFVRNEAVSAASVTGVGGFSVVDLGFFDTEKREYRHILVHQQVEVLSFVGNVALQADGSPKVHAHVVVGLEDGTTRGGHLFANSVKPTLEVVLTEEPAQLRRRTDPATGLALLDV